MKLCFSGSSGGTSAWGGPSPNASLSGLTTPSSVPTPFNTPVPPPGSGAGGGASPGGSLITTEMFSQALQNALAASASSVRKEANLPRILSFSLNSLFLVVKDDWVEHGTLVWRKCF